MASAAAAATAAEWEVAEQKVLVARKPCFSLPTACPTSFPVLLYLRMAQVPFDIHVDTSFPDTDHIPYVEFGDCVAFNNEKGGVIQYLKEEKILDLNSKHPGVSPADVLSTKAMVSTWLADALQYKLWVVSDGSITHDIYFSDLPWPIGKILHWKKSRAVKQLLDITKLNAAEKEEEIYKKASAAYDALSLRLGDQVFLFDNSPTDVDALFLGHALFVLNALPDTSVLRGTLEKHENLVNFVENHKIQLLKDSSSSSPSSSSTPRKRASTGPICTQDSISAVFFFLIVVCSWITSLPNRCIQVSNRSIFLLVKKKGLRISVQSQIVPTVVPCTSTRPRMIR